MQWSRLRAQVESLFADSVKGRVRLHSTRYRRMHDQEGRDWITVDGQELLNMPHWHSWAFAWGSARELEEDDERSPYASLFRNGSLGRAVFAYVNLSIDEILCSENALIRAIGMLDRRVGKRRLRAFDADDAHPLVRVLYYFRCEAEGLLVADSGPPSRELDLDRTVWASTDSESDEERRQRAIARLEQSRKTRNPRSLVSRIHHGQLAEDELDTPLAQHLHAGFQQAVDRDTLYQTLTYVETKSKLLKSPEHARGVIELAKDSALWVRPLEEWEPKSHNPHRQFSSLARHLWASYDVPVFMDKAWLHGTSVEQAWFKHVGSGKNIRTAKDIPVPLTKRMAHRFLEAPEDYTIEAAFRWGQVQALGGDKRLADMLRETRIAREFRENEFWLSVIRFLVDNPMLDPVHITPIIDYLWNQRYEPRVVFVERGVAQEVGPEQPNLSMRGRTASSLLKAVEAWHRQLGREIKGGHFQWRKSAIQDYEFVEGSEASRNMKVWRIRELLSSQELQAEGRRMRHCVASYAGSCHKGTATIWSMTVETVDGVEPLLTIEMMPGQKRIGQVRGKRNRYPTEKEQNVLTRWASSEDLTLPPRLD